MLRLRIEFRLDEHWELRYDAKAQWESIYPNFSSVTCQQKSLDLDFGAAELLSPALALAEGLEQSLKEFPARSLLRQCISPERAQPMVSRSSL